jgi:hypothetical protein
MAKTRGAYPPEFRRQMVELVHAGRTPEELAHEFVSSGSGRISGKGVSFGRSATQLSATAAGGADTHRHGSEVSSRNGDSSC